MHNDNNIGTTSALSFDENDDEFRLKLESESINEKSDYTSFDENNEKCRRNNECVENISSLIQHYHNAAEINVDNNYNNDKNNLSSSKEGATSIELSSVGLDFLKFIKNNKSSSLDNKNNKKNESFCFDPMLSSPKQLQTNVSLHNYNFNNNNNNASPMALLDAINFLKPNDNLFKPVTERGSNGNSSSISMSPSPSSTLINLSNTNNSKLNLNKEHLSPNATNNVSSTILDLSFAMSLFQQASSFFNNNNTNNKNNNNNNKVYKFLIKKNISIN